MIFFFNKKADQNYVNPEQTIKVSLLIMKLNEHLGFNKFDHEFYDFIRENYKIDTKFLLGNIIESIEMPDDVYTMLLLMYDATDRYYRY